MAKSARSRQVLGNLVSDRLYRFTDSVTTAAPLDRFRFRLSRSSNLRLRLTESLGDAELSLERGGRSIALGGTADEINQILPPGAYSVTVQQRSGSANYALSLQPIGLASPVRSQGQQFPINLWRYDAQGRVVQGAGILPNRPTTIVIHGWRNSDRSPKIRELAKAASRSGNQVLALNWGSIAQAGLDDSVPLKTAGWVGPVSRWLGARLTALGVRSEQLSLVGHSLGAYIGGETAQLWRSGNRPVQTLVALDPAFPANSYDLDRDRPGRNSPVDFGTVARRSLAWVVADGGRNLGAAGDNDRAVTAQTSFVIRFVGRLPPTNAANPIENFVQQNTDAHGATIDSFTDALTRRFVTLPSLRLPALVSNWYDNNGNRDNAIDRRLNLGNQDGVLFLRWTGAKLEWQDGRSPWQIVRLLRVANATGIERSAWT